MQPRVDIVALPVEATAPDILRTAIETRYSRIPVYRGDIDHIVGIVFSKDLLLYIQSAAAESAALESLTTRISSPSSPLPKVRPWSERPPSPSTISAVHNNVVLFHLHM